MTYHAHPAYPAQQPGYRPLPQPMSPGGQPLADFGTRLLAYLIDMAIMTGVSVAVFTPIIVIFTFSRLEGLDPAVTSDADFFGEFVGPLLLLEAGLFAFLLVVYYVYYVEMLRRSGQTVGKKAMKIRVVPIDPAQSLTRGIAAKRYLVEFVAGMFVPLFSYLDGFWQLWDKPHQQTLHDKFAKTVVVKVAP